MRAGSLPDLLKVIPAGSAERWKGLDAKDEMKFLEIAAPVKVTYLRVRESGSEATLEYQADSVTGTVKMKNENGSWKLVREKQKDSRTLSSKSWKF